MSARTRIVRGGLRVFFKWASLRREPKIHRIRRRVEFMKRLVPNPPGDTAEISLTVAGMPAVRVMTPRSRDDRHILYLHGGGYVAGSTQLYRDFIWRVADATETRVLCINYRLAPEHPFPAAVDDSIAAYRWLLSQGADPRRMTIMGDSAGGGLTFATLLRLRDERAPLPASAVALSPWTDLALTGETYKSNARSDPMVNVRQVPALARHYLASADPKHPYASPLYGDPRGLPPTLIQVGSDEILRDDAERIAEKLRAVASAVELQIWPNMPHVWQTMARVLPEARQAIDRIGEFVRQTQAPK